jgi:hypothetical protein
VGVGVVRRWAVVEALVGCFKRLVLLLHLVLL